MPIAIKSDIIELSSEYNGTDWLNFVKNPSDIFDKDKTNSLNTEKKSRFRFDLHGFTLDQANKKVKEINPIGFAIGNKNLYLTNYDG